MWLELARNGWQWLEMDRKEWKYLEISRNGVYGKKLLERAKIASNG